MLTFAAGFGLWKNRCLQMWSWYQGVPEDEHPTYGALSDLT